MNFTPCSMEKNLVPYMTDDQIINDITAIFEFAVLSFFEYQLSEGSQEEKQSFLRQVISEYRTVNELYHHKLKLSFVITKFSRILQIFDKLLFTDFEEFIFSFFLAYQKSHVIQVAMSSLHKDYILKQSFINIYKFLHGNEKTSMADLLQYKTLNTLYFEDIPTVPHTVVLSNPLLSFALGGTLPMLDTVDDLSPLLIYDTILEETHSICKEQGLDSVDIFHANYQATHPIVLYLYGEKYSGKRHFSRQLSQLLHRPFICLEWNRFLLVEHKERTTILRELELSAKLSNAVICLCNVESSSPQETQLLSITTKQISTFTRLFIITGVQKEDFSQDSFENFFSKHLPLLTASEKISVWDYYKNIYQATTDSIRNGNKYVLNTGEIKQVFQTAALISTNTIDDYAIHMALQMLGNQLEGAHLIHSDFHFSDFIADEEIYRQMQHIIDQMNYRSKIYDDWGFGEKTPYGRGISVLFFGPPGTGKTMAASVIANELNLDLYRVDLSKMVSKYIGETEKNITKLFDQAKSMNIVLFFDEADSLFAKRSEVKDSNDRNANAETAHLLQKLEDYEGISILATNLVDQLDDAFKRRIKFMIPFKFPDATTRLTLWKELIPEKALCDDDIDLEFFADGFELSGSQIKEIILNAAYMAAATNEPLGNQQLKEATVLNYQKYGKRLTSDDFGYLR